MKFVAIIGLLVFGVFADLGGIVDVDPNNPAVKEMIQFAYNLIHDSINSAHALTMGKVLKTQSQVVSGVEYYLTLEVNETDCDKKVVDVSKCNVIRTEVCNAKVLSKPWDGEHKKQLLSYQCQGN